MNNSIVSVWAMPAARRSERRLVAWLCLSVPQRCRVQPASSISLHPEVAKPFDLCCLFNIYCDFNASHYVRNQDSLEKITGRSRTPHPPPGLYAITTESNESLVKHVTNSIICSEKKRLHRWIFNLIEQVKKNADTKTIQNNCSK